MTSQTQPTLALNDGPAIRSSGLASSRHRLTRRRGWSKWRSTKAIAWSISASMYRNEEGVGEALLGRTDVFVTTKLGNSDHGFDEALRAFDASIKKLRRDTLDLYLIHWPRPRVNRYVESWKALVRLQKDRRNRSISVSNFNRDHLERIVGRQASRLR